ncbi:MAG: hypothetical protein C0404_07355 [Verrucomicrobia bacterium]|nr:hypothetical protein [Verrucomicrobiota bacterium]
MKKTVLIAAAGWALLVAGAVSNAESRIENDKLSISGQAGGAGLTMSSKQTKNKLELRLLDAAGVAGKIKSVKEGKSDDEGKSLKVVTDGGEALVTLGMGRAYAEIKPVKGLKAVALGVPTRFAVMPDFFAMDVALDARHVKQDKAVALADNFYLMPLDGGNAMAFCVWPGADPKEQTREESVVEFTVGGEGEARKFTESRAYFPGSKPVYVALLEGTNCWRYEDVTSQTMDQAVKIDWKRPFDARWRATFMTMDGKLVPGWNVSIISYFFPDPKKFGTGGWYFDEAINSGMGYRNGMPQGDTQGLGNYVHQCWFKQDETWLYLWKKPFGRSPPMDGKFESVIIYPLDRAKDTPITELALADVVKQTLGVGPCEYILDKEGAVWAYHGGTNKMHFEGATCGNWDWHLNPRLNEWKSKGSLDAKKKQEVVWLIEDMGTFIAAVNKRMHAYDDFRKTVKGLCDAAKKGGKEDAALAAALEGDLNAMQQTLSNLPEFDKGLARWQETLSKMQELAKSSEEFKPELSSIGNVRGHAENQDNTIAGCRRCVNMIKQKAGVAVNEAGSGSTSLAVKIREECRKVLRKPHPLEHF